MTTQEKIVSIGIIAFATMLTRFLPFLLFKNDPPKYINSLGKYLPPASFAMIAVYSSRHINPTQVNSFLPYLITISFLIAIHLWKRNSLLSISLSTLLYMILVQAVFV